MMVHGECSYEYMGADNDLPAITSVSQITSVQEKKIYPSIATTRTIR